ncbi:MAG: phosphatase PAP2 family protein [Anaerolineaceae bacterium]|nr:phosphatase PAP2 family protein [Anaerolineaceae bacterium]
MRWKELVDWDAKLSAQLRSHPGHKGFWKAAVFFAHSGDSWFWLAGLLVVWLFANDTWHYISAVLAFSLTLEAIFVLAVKFLVKRKRPAGEWGGIYRNTDPHSFPSGHAARAILIAVMGWAIAPAWFGWVLVIWAPLVCLARVMTGVHYLSDVIAGILVGLASGFLMLQLMPVFVPLVNSIIPFAF